MVLALRTYRTVEIYSTGSTVTDYIISEIVGHIPLSFLSSFLYFYRRVSFPVAFFSFSFFFFIYFLIVPTRYFLYSQFPFCNVRRTKYSIWVSKPAVQKPSISPYNEMLQNSEENTWKLLF